jgi:ATP-dependent Clp protease ATP-binding subunit ClpA
MGITRKTIVEILERSIQNGPDMITLGRLPCTPRVKNVIMYAMEASRKLNHDYVGTEHLLLGLIREENGVASSVLKALDVTAENFLTSCEGVIEEQQGKMPNSEKLFLEALSQFKPLSIKKPEAGTEDFRVEQLKNIASAIYRFSNGECTSETCLTEIRQIVS